MDISVCMKASRVPEFEKGDLRYIEIAAVDVALSEKDDFADLFKSIEQKEFEVISSYQFVYGDFDVCKGGYDRDYLQKYVTTVGDRLSALGCPKVVFGSGKARSLDPEYGVEKGLSQFYDFLSISCDTLARYGMTVVIEPLRSSETNFINRVNEGYDVAVKSGRDNCAVLCDYFHFTEEKEPLKDLEYAKDRLAHFHIAHPGDRDVPLPEDGYDYSVLFGKLKKIGYDGFVSIEGKRRDPETMKRSIAHLYSYIK